VLFRCWLDGPASNLRIGGRNRRWRSPPVPRGRDVLRQHHQEGARPSRGLRARSAFGGSRSIAPPRVERPPARAWLESVCRILYDWRRREWPRRAKGGCARRMRSRCSTRQAARVEPTASRSHVGSQQRKVKGGDRAGDGPTLFRDAPSAASIVDGNYGRPVSRQIPQGRTPRGCNMAGRYSAHWQALSATRSARPSSSGPRHGRQCQHHPSRRSRSDLQEEPTEDEVRWVYLDIGKFGGRAETWTNASNPLRIRHPHDGAKNDALSARPGRPAVPPTCRTRRSVRRCGDARDRRQGVIEGRPDYYLDPFLEVALNAFPPCGTIISEQKSGGRRRPAPSPHHAELPTKVCSGPGRERNAAKKPRLKFTPHAALMWSPRQRHAGPVLVMRFCNV